MTGTTGEHNRPLLLQVSDLRMSYGFTRALRDVAFSLDRGEVVAVIGENGAGKSTFAKILAGAIRPEAGQIKFQGVPVNFHSPRDALRHGIAFIPQELACIPTLTVAENILLGQWPNRAGFTSQAAIRRRARVEVERFDLDVDVWRQMSSLKLADRQLVEIVKALARRAQLILLDEPTASLSEAESQRLFAVLRKLVVEGVGILYISHRMDEVHRFSDRVDVFRSGLLVASVPTARTTPDELITHMLGRAAETFIPARISLEAAREPVISLVNWSATGLTNLSDVNLSVSRGEIVGLFGLRGCGADLVAEGLAGLRHDIQGQIILDGRTTEVFRNPLAARRAGIAYVPVERRKNGLVLPLPTQENLSLLVLKLVSAFGFLKRSAERALGSQLVSRFDIRLRDLNQLVSELSGGNQQKVMLASRLAQQPKMLVLHEPTRGVDVGARFEIHRFLRDIATAGTVILLVTSDIEEAVAVSDRLLIMWEGRVVDELTGSRKTQGQALRAATKASQ